MTSADTTALRFIALLLLAGAACITVFALGLRYVLTHPVEAPRDE